MEMKFLHDMKDNERVLDFAATDIKRVTIKLEKKRDLLMASYSSQPLPAKVQSKVNNRRKNQRS